MPIITRDQLPDEYRQIWDDMLMPVDTNIKLSSVILSDENKDKIQRFIKEIKYHDKLLEHGLEPQNRILMYGASGTGKTFLTKALSNHLGYTMLYVDIAKSLSEGNVAYNVSQIFKLGNYIGHCIIFFDECDSVAWARNDANNRDSADMRRATNAIFQGLDQMNATNIFISATNLMENLDFAFRRRFNLEMEFLKPSLDIDKAILHFINPTFKIVDDVPEQEKAIIKRRAKGNALLSYYDIEMIVKEGMKRAVLSNTDKVHTIDIYNDLQQAMHFNLNNGGRIDRADLPKEYQTIWDKVLMYVDTNIFIEDVILSEENKEKIERFLKEMEYRDKLLEYKLDVQNRILMYGASGTGKTFLTKALSNQLEYTMLYVDIAKSLTEGNVAENISDIFKLGNYIGKAIIFLDECDSIAWARDTSNNDTGVIRRATNSVFQNLDQMNPECVFIAATNMLHRLDNAFERRFNVKMRFTRPQLDIDEAVKHFLYSRFILDDDVNPIERDIVKRRAKQNAKLSYYEIENIVKEGMKKAVLNDTNVVHTSDIYKDLQVGMNFKIRYGTGDDNPEIFENDSHYEPKEPEEIVLRTS